LARYYWHGVVNLMSFTWLIMTINTLLWLYLYRWLLFYFGNAEIDSELSTVQFFFFFWQDWSSEAEHELPSRGKQQPGKAGDTARAVLFHRAERILDCWFHARKATTLRQSRGWLKDSLTKAYCSHESSDYWYTSLLSTMYRTKSMTDSSHPLRTISVRKRTAFIGAPPVKDCDVQLTIYGLLQASMKWINLSESDLLSFLWL
jgi:hypothetical protein